MNLDELQALGPYFRDGERYLNGTVIDWADVDSRTMFWLVKLREYLDAPIRLIRGAHPSRPSAIDACCSEMPMAQVFMALTRVQQCSWGIYSGGSFHLDTREFDYLPARWMAIKPTEEGHLTDRGLQSTIASRKDGWTYLAYSHPRAFEALGLVCELAERRRA